MRSYLDIIIDLKNGKKPDYEEVRLACLMAADLLFFTEEDLERTVKPVVPDIIKSLTQKSIESRFYAKKKSPEEYLGKHHPDNPEQQKWMKLGNKLLDKILKDNNKDAGR